MRANISFYIILAVQLLGSTSGQDIVSTCSNDIEVYFGRDIFLSTSFENYNLKRSFRSEDKNCAGTIEINGYDEERKGFLLVELENDVFSDLPMVTEIKAPHTRISRSTREMYEGSPLIKSIDFREAAIQKLDSSLLFPETLQKLNVKATTYLSEVKLEFFYNHQSLTELDISEPQFVLDFSFESGLFQNVAPLEKLTMQRMPVKYLEKGLLSKHASSLKRVDMTRWNDLTAAESNAFGEVFLDDLDLSEWPFSVIDNNLFSGASIKNLIFSGAKITSLTSGSLANLKDTENLNFIGSKLTSIDTGAFQDFMPSDNLKLDVPKEVLCCNAIGLFELKGNVNGLLINNNSTHYQCTKPGGSITSVQIDSDPSDGLACCDPANQVYDPSSDTCIACEVADECISPDKSVCRSGNFGCNACNTGFFLAADFSCGACKIHSNCTIASETCDSDGLFSCDKCKDGFSIDESSQLCTACTEIEGSPCLEYGSTCVEGFFSNELKCNVCQEGYSVGSNGRCETVTDTLSMGVIIGGAVGGVVVLTVFSILLALLGVKLWKAREKRRLMSLFGIELSEVGVILQTDEEFNEAVARGQAQPEQSFAGPIDSNFYGVQATDKNQNEYVGQHSTNVLLQDEDYAVPQASKRKGSIVTISDRRPSIVTNSDRRPSVSTIPDDENYCSSQPRRSSVVKNISCGTVMSTKMIKEDSVIDIDNDNYITPETPEAKHRRMSRLPQDFDEYSVPEPSDIRVTNLISQQGSEEYCLPESRDITVDVAEEEYFVPETPQTINLDACMADSEYFVPDTQKTTNVAVSCPADEGEYYTPETPKTTDVIVSSLVDESEYFIPETQKTTDVAISYQVEEGEYYVPETQMVDPVDEGEYYIPETQKPVDATNAEDLINGDEYCIPETLPDV